MYPREGNVRPSARPSASWGGTTSFSSPTRAANWTNTPASSGTKAERCGRNSSTKVISTPLPTIATSASRKTSTFASRATSTCSSASPTPGCSATSWTIGAARATTTSGHQYTFRTARRSSPASSTALATAAATGYWYSFLYNEDYGQTRLQRIWLLPLSIMKMLGFRNSISQFREAGCEEDAIISLWAHSAWGLSCHVPDELEAARFSFEVHPRYLYNRIGGQLPFGCHAFEKWEYDTFWKKHITA